MRDPRLRRERHFVVKAYVETTAPSPTAPGPTAPGPTAPGPTAPGPTAPELEANHGIELSDQEMTEAVSVSKIREVLRQRG